MDNPWQKKNHIFEIPNFQVSKTDQKITNEVSIH